MCDPHYSLTPWCVSLAERALPWTSLTCVGCAPNPDRASITHCCVYVMHVAQKEKEKRLRRQTTLARLTPPPAPFCYFVLPRCFRVQVHTYVDTKTYLKNRPPSSSSAAEHQTGASVNMRGARPGPRTFRSYQGTTTAKRQDRWGGGERQTQRHRENPNRPRKTGFGTPRLMPSSPA